MIVGDVCEFRCDMGNNGLGSWVQMIDKLEAMQPTPPNGIAWCVVIFVSDVTKYELKHENRQEKENT